MFTRPTGRQLAMRTPSAAAFLGAFAGADFGEDFGGFGGFGLDTAITESERLASQNWRRGNTQTARQLDIDAHSMAVAHNQLASSHRAQLADHSLAMRERARLDMLNPNAGLSVKVARYSFPINQNIVIGTGIGINMTLQPSVTIRPQRVVMNSPIPTFIMISAISVANVSVLLGGSDDAFTYSALAVGVHLDMPTLDPSYRATVTGSYGGLVATPYAVGYVFPFTTTFQGPATVTNER
jgi:hypothetical protein